jgi:hypothetical protein
MLHLAVAPTVRPNFCPTSLHREGDPMEDRAHESPEDLRRDVDAIRANPELIAQISQRLWPKEDPTPVPPSFDVVLQAWAQLPERDRLVWRRLFGLDGQAPATQAELAARLGVTTVRIRQLKPQIAGRFNQLVWAEAHGFHDLPKPLIRAVRRSGAAGPTSLKDHINDMFKGYFGPVKFRRLNDWLIERDGESASLIPYLSDGKRKMLNLGDG